jgi:hypothetical protein
MAGTFPAAALLYRLGYVKTAQPSVVEHRSLKDLWQGKVPVIAEDAGFDPNRDMAEFPKNAPVSTAVDPLAYLVGPVKVVFGSDASKTKVADLKPYIDKSEGIVKSLTGEVTMNYASGYCLVNSPKAQGVTGFLGEKGNFKLDTVTLAAKNKFGSVLVVSLDQKDLKDSSKVLVQVGTESRPTGWRDKTVEIDAGGGKKQPGLEIVNYGRAPWAVVSPELLIRVNNSKLSTATVLDMNGNAMKRIPLSKTANGVSFEFPYGAMYVVLS